MQRKGTKQIGCDKNTNTCNGKTTKLEINRRNETKKGKKQMLTDCPFCTPEQLQMQDPKSSQSTQETPQTQKHRPCTQTTSKDARGSEIQSDRNFTNI